MANFHNIPRSKTT